MSGLIDLIRQKAKNAQKHIVLAEGNDERVIRAAQEITKEKIAKISLIGNLKSIKEKCPDVKLDNVNVIDLDTIDLSDYANLLFELRKAKGLDLEKAKKLVRDPLYFGVLMVKRGEADGMVAGAINSTGDVLRPALQVIKTAQGINTVSSCFVMVMPDHVKNYSNVMIFGDCAVNPNPTAAQLADIAIASADSAKKIAGLDPYVAMLSYSTKGSASGELVDKVVEAVALVKAAAPELKVDGELQADAALVESVAKLKAKGSDVAGRANVLIFPDLQSGNISYKLVQRLAGAEAVGPICQGFNKPVNDLSRGCSVEDVVNVVAMTALQAI